MLRWSWAVGGFVLLVGLLVIVAPAVRHGGALFDDPFAGRVERRTVETLDASGRVTGTVVTTEPAGSWLERSLGPGGVLLLRVAVVAVAAFMAGALIYRTASGNFPTEVAGVKFAEKTTGGLDELTRTVATVVARVEGLSAELNRVSAAGADGVAAVAKLNDRVDVTEERNDALHVAVVGIASGLSEVAADLEALKAEVAGERTARRRSPKAQ
jgi:hypothetical protein